MISKLNLKVGIINAYYIGIIYKRMGKYNIIFLYKHKIPITYLRIKV